MRKALTLLIISLIFIVSLSARERPAILVQTENGEYTPLKMSDIQIDVSVIGNLAVTTMDITFYNDLNRVLEGQFYFPLSEGRTVTRFALDVNGKLREGVIVEREKGRAVYESTIRQHIDPGLLEWTKGNNFKARIYPVPAKGHKRLVIAYEQELQDEKEGFLYILPLEFKQKVDNCSIKVEVFKQNVRPMLSSSNELVNFSFKKWKESYIAEVNEKNYLPDKQLAFLLPKTKAYEEVSIEQVDGTTYFYAHLNPDIIQSTKTLPKKICLLWDASLSSEKKERQREFDLLESYIKICGNVSIEVIIFRNDVENKPMVFPIKNGNWDTLKSYLTTIPFDGGTQLGSLDLNRYSCDEFILLTDGISTFGAREMTLSSTPVIVINSQLTARHSCLNYIARKTGGVYINLKNISHIEAISLLKNLPYSFLKAEFKNNQVKEVFPSLPAGITKDFSIAGILTSKNAKIILHFGIGNKTMYTKTITLEQPPLMSESGLIQRIWAQKKIAELDMEYEKNKDEIMTMGRKYSIVTRNTSLIILDRIEDYITHRIIPPKELQNEYYSIINLEEKNRGNIEKSRIEEVVQKFQKIKEWWNMTFSWDPPPDVEKSKKEAIEEGERALSREESFDDNPGAGDYDSELSTTGAEDERTAEEPRPGQPETTENTSGSIELSGWNPDTPYLKELKKANDKDTYKVYLRLRKDYPASSAFYLDVADFFMEKKQKDIALRILSNIAEMELENHQLLRILGHRLSQLGYIKLAIFVFEEVQAMREEEPQSYRDLGNAYAKDGQYQKAVNFLYEVVKRKWDDRFPDIEVIALVEMNSLIATHGNINTTQIDERLIKNLPVDLRVVLDWDADNCDMDLWVINPNGEKCYYSNPLTYLGGHMSRDFTRGYGPEEYMLKKAKPGNYTIQVNYYGNTQQIIAGATTILVRLILNFGTKNEEVKEITLRLKDNKEVVTIGQFTIKMKNGNMQF